jgi:hypothetical protein
VGNEIPLIVTAKGSFSVSGGPGNSASFLAYFGTVQHPKQDPIIGYDSGLGHSSWEESRTITENVLLGTTYAVWMEAYGQAQGNGQFQVIIDPMIRIDPNWMVWNNGNLVPGNQFFSLTFSPGFNSVPLPGVLMLLLD